MTDKLAKLDLAYRELVAERDKLIASLEAEKAELDRTNQELTANYRALEEEKKQLVASAEVKAKEQDQTLAQLQRLGAEFDNFQKRNKKEKLQWTSKAVSDVLTQFVPALDNLDSVINACSAIAEPNEEIDGLNKGLALIRDEFLKTLRQYDVEKIVPQSGDAFDPNFHCAISIQHAEVEQETVGYVARPGYVIGNNVLRPAEVIVSKNIYG
jgi:molecular chaperone GrpE